MTETEHTTQQQKDIQTQSDLTGKVGARLSQPEKSSTSPWGAIKRLLRIR